MFQRLLFPEGCMRARIFTDFIRSLFRAQNNRFRPILDLTLDDRPYQLSSCDFLLCFGPENRQNQKEHDTRMVNFPPRTPPLEKFLCALLVLTYASETWSLTLREEEALRNFERNTLLYILGGIQVNGS
ncbi:hypothetical protein TNCV_4040212 [Trichonephila clavipes]|nr:hypothetical protein TNCV_4040212 [Trichonephila clavipes]